MHIRTTLSSAAACLMMMLGAAGEPVKIGEGRELIIGGFDPSKKEDVPRLVAELDEKIIPQWKQLGVTSHEGYVRWNLCEPEEGKYDWSVYDPFVETYKKHGIKWVPFVIVGSPYTIPDWYYKKPPSQGYVCLEHGEESDVESLWNPAMREHVARFLKNFCEHYRDSGAVESILLGITGNYGEAIYVATGNDWTASVHGNYHTHAGFWAGDPYAIQSFRDWLRKKYETDETLSKTWGGEPRKIDEVKPFLRADAPNDRAWVDFVDWYTESMTEWAEFWMTETRKHWDGPIYLCTGGHAPAEHGADFGEQCRIASKVGGGVRITNEGSDYGINMTHTRWVASAGRQYGAYYSFEPAGEVKPDAVVYRIYNATASGAKGLHYYHPNIWGSEEARQAFARWGHEWKERNPLVEVAVYYPSTDIKLNGQHVLERARHLRDRFDFDFVSDNQIRHGGLKDRKALVLLFGTVFEKDVADAIHQWVRDGGVLVYGDVVGRLRTVEGDSSIHDKLLSGDPGKGQILLLRDNADDSAYRDFVTTALADCEELSPQTRRMIRSDGKQDGVYVTLCDGELLWLNVNSREIQTTVTLPPNSMVSEPLR